MEASLMMEVHVSPTLCRPRQLDRERLRRLLPAAQFARLRYQEAVVAAATPQLLALSNDALFLLPLANPNVRSVRCVWLQAVELVERVVPCSTRQRALLLLPRSQLFRLQLRAPERETELLLATFESQSQLFFQLSRLLRVHLQRQLLPAAAAALQTPRLELSRLLQTLATDVAHASDSAQRAALLDELAEAAARSPELQQLFFEDRTAVTGCAGLAAFARRQLGQPLVRQQDVVLLLSIVRVLGVVCFDAPPGSRALAVLPLEELVTHLLARGAESFRVGARSTSRTLRCEELLDAQAALLLALDAMQQLSAFQQRLQQPTVALLARRAPTFELWLHKFFKRVCVSVSRVATASARSIRSDSDSERESERESEDEGEDKDEDPYERRQALALWRSVTWLLLLVGSDASVLSLLLRRRKDLIDMYLRPRRLLDALQASKRPQLQDVAQKLQALLEALQTHRNMD